MRTLRCSEKRFGQTFSQKGISISYQRAPLDSLRDEEAKLQGQTTAAPLVEIVTWRDKEVEAADLARRIQKKRKDNDKDKDKDQRCRWSDFAVLYRQHNHRDELVKELAERGIPFSIEGLDVLDTPEVRDAVACLTAAVSPNDAASLFRVAALPQFGIDPMELRAAMRAVRRQELDLRTVLGRLAGGPAVLESVEKVHREVKEEGVGAGFTAEDAVSVVIRHFHLQRSALLAAFLKFVESWHTKPIAKTGSPSEFLEYLDYFVQAGGTIPLPRSEDDAVQLLTAHAAKGLEFQHVAIIRGSSVWFPTPYHEPLIAFPTELRRAATSSPGAVHDDKTLHEEEERRLFYVAMTRAKDTLAIYAHQGRGKKDPKPTQFLREFMVHPAYKKFWSSHPAAAVQDRLFAEEEQRIAVPQSTVAAWLLMPPSASFVTGLSASAIEIYEECPLRFKLEREWNLPRDVPASLHYGAAMHGVLRTFYDAQRYSVRSATTICWSSSGRPWLPRASPTAISMSCICGREWSSCGNSSSGLAVPSRQKSSRPNADLNCKWARRSWPDGWIASIARVRTRLPSWTTRRASRSRKRMPTRACNFPYMRSRPGRLGGSVPTA